MDIEYKIQTLRHSPQKDLLVAVSSLSSSKDSDDQATGLQCPV